MLYFQCCSVRLAKSFLALRMTNTQSYFSEVQIELNVMLRKSTRVRLLLLIADGERLVRYAAELTLLYSSV